MKRTARAFMQKVTAALVVLGALPVAAQQTASTAATDTWQFIATPYLWGAGLNGSARVGTAVPAQNVDASFSDILSDLNWGAMGTFEARKGQWGIVVDAFYVQLSHTSQPLLDGALGTARLQANDTLVEAAAAYRAVDNDTTWVDVLLGLRYFNLSAKITLNPSTLLPGGASRSGSADWTDGFIGLRARQGFGRGWSLFEYADFGGGGSSYSYQAILGVGWDISKMFGLQLGYRLLAEDYSTSSLLYDMRMGGPYLGLSITF